MLIGYAFKKKHILGNTVKLNQSQKEKLSMWGTKEQ